MTKITLSPDPVVVGADGVFSIEGDNPKTTIEGGTLEVKVGTANLPLVDTTIDICELTSCPIKPGPIDVVTKQPFPAFLPPLTLSGRVEGKDTSGTSLFCVDLSFQIVQPSQKME